MEGIEHEIKKQAMARHKNKNKLIPFKQYEKIDQIPVRDRLYVNYNKEFIRQLFQKGKEGANYF
jgi:hypothetical protein